MLALSQPFEDYGAGISVSSRPTPWMLQGQSCPQTSSLSSSSDRRQPILAIESNGRVVSA